jgi:hypothetical protein
MGRIFFFWRRVLDQQALSWLPSRQFFGEPKAAVDLWLKVMCSPLNEHLR